MIGAGIQQKLHFLAHAPPDNGIVSVEAKRQCLAVIDLRSHLLVDQIELSSSSVGARFQTALNEVAS